MPRRLPIQHSHDRLEHDNAESARLHLCADLAYQEKLLRFVENHDEPRAAATFAPTKERAAAVATSTLTAARMFHEGQFEGRKLRLPVFLGRRTQEPVDTALREFYRKLLRAINSPVFRDVNGVCASAQAGRTIRPARTSPPGAGKRTTSDI